MNQKPELLAPVQNFATLKAASKYADAVYFGAKKFNMRMNANNFTPSEIRKAVKFCHDRNMKAYLTTNIIIYDDELEKVRNLIEIANSADIDAVIVHDIGAIELANEADVDIHISTQANISNTETAKFYQKLGAKRIVLARELNLKQIKKIKEGINAEIEAFVYGAMCVSVSGRCFMSATLYGKSANRGNCLQPCRRQWIVKEEEGNELIYDGLRFLNAKDLCMIEHIPELIDAKIDTWKIEGRMKDPLYVDTVLRVHREALEAYFKNEYTPDKAKEWKKQLSKVYNRGFSTGFYFGMPTNKQIELKEHGTKALLKKKIAGKVLNYYRKNSVAEIQLNDRGIKTGEEIIVQGNTTFLKQKVESMQIEGRPINKAKKGTTVGLKVNEKVRKNDLIFVIKGASKEFK